MLNKKERLTKKEFDRSFSLGKRVHSPVLQLIISDSPSFHGAVVVGKKVKKKAVDRNALRRRLYGVVYRFYQDHPKAHTVIVVAKPAVALMSKKEQREALMKLLLDT